MIEAINLVMGQADEMATVKSSLIVVPTGFDELTELIGGWAKSQLIVIGGVTGIGKSALVQAFTLNSGINLKVPVMHISFEDSKVDIGNRFMSQLTGIPFLKIKKGDMEMNGWEELNNKASKFKSSPINIQCYPPMNITLSKIKNKLVKEIKDKGVRLLIVDGIQGVKGENVKDQNRDQEIATITRGLKSIAMELEVTIIVTSPVTKDVIRNGGDCKPRLVDLRDSGIISDTADVILFLDRQDYHGITEDEEGVSTKNVAELIVAKNRNGDLGSFKLGYNRYCTRFEKKPIEDYWYEKAYSVIRANGFDNLEDDVPF